MNQCTELANSELKARTNPIKDWIKYSKMQMTKITKLDIYFISQERNAVTMFPVEESFQIANLRKWQSVNHWQKSRLGINLDVQIKQKIIEICMYTTKI